MAFHVACPITCRRICYCKLGFPPELRSEKAQKEFLEFTGMVQAMIDNPSLIYSKPKTVQVLVPKVVTTPPHPTQAFVTQNVAAAINGGEDAEELSSAQTKRVAIQKKEIATSVVVEEDEARRSESGNMALGFHSDLAGDEQGLSNAKVMCRLCFSGESEGSERARKMLSCKTCSKKYHRSCVKSWAQNRDLFHWSSWTCPSCRTCEACRKTGDPQKLMFCKRCDGAYHCHCQQPPHKNVSSGPYLCPKHTRCHSCSSTVPGNGSSVRWFLGYTCCDACGRLFVKGNYCPVCLKVYRDSESTPMVCCDICQRWVHCHCDGISDERYSQYQVDNNLQYRCATCRGECYQVRDLEDAIQELWRRRDKADRELTASLRAAAGLPTQDEIFCIQPYSDDDDNGPSLKNEYDRSLKFSLKGAVDKSPKKSKEFLKKSASKQYGKKKGFPAPLFSRTEPRVEGHSDAQSTGFIVGDNKDGDVQSYRSEEAESLLLRVANNSGVGKRSSNHSGFLKRTNVNEARVKAKTAKDNGSLGEETMDESGKHADKSMTAKGPKLVIHLGAKNKNVANSPKSDASDLLREPGLATSNGKNSDNPDQPKGLKFKGKDGNTIKIRKLNPENSDAYSVGGSTKLTDKHQSISPVKARVLFGKRSTERSVASEAPAIRGQKTSGDHLKDDKRELKPLLRLKFKNPYAENHSSWASSAEDDKSLVKGQRSKRKRPSPLLDTSSVKEEEGPGELYGAFDPIDHEIMDANWIIHTLGKDAIGKKVEVHQSSNNAWHKGTVVEVIEGTSIVSVASEDGTVSNVNLRKQGIRFDSQKRRR